FPALRRFLTRAVVYTMLLGLPAAAVAFFVSNRAVPVYSVEATLLAPRRSIDVDLPNEVPGASGPILPLAYGAALQSVGVLTESWRRLNPNDTAEPTVGDVETLRDSVNFRFEERPRSTLIMVGAEGSAAAIAMA